MELRVLRYFMAIAEERNISAAASRLNLTQPTLSRQARELEEELGARLFDRSRRRLVLTEDGKLFLERAREILSLASKAKAELAGSNKELGGEISIGGAETEAMRVIARAVKRLRDAHPKVTFNFHSGNAQQVSKRMDMGLIDFGVFIRPVDLSEYDFLSLPYEEFWGLLARKDNDLAKLSAITPQDLIGVNLLCSQQALESNELSGWLGEARKKINVIATYNLLFNASLMVQEGVGSAIGLDKIVNPQATNLVFIPFFPVVKGEVVLAWKKGRELSKVARLFIEIIQAIKNESLG